MSTPASDSPGDNPGYMGAIADDPVEDVIQSADPTVLPLDLPELHAANIQRDGLRADGCPHAPPAPTISQTKGKERHAVKHWRRSPRF